MSTHQSPERDERAVAVIDASCRWAFVFLFFALIIDMMYRTIVRQNAWDLLAMFIGSTAIATIYQARQKILGKAYWVRAAWMGAVSGVVVAIVGVVVPAMTQDGQDAGWIGAVTCFVIGITVAVASITVGVVKAAMARNRSRGRAKKASTG